MNSHSVSRRHFLRGMGIAMSLPWLESMNSWGAAARPAAAERRRAAAGGVLHGQRREPATIGAARIGPGGLELMKSLTPLEPLKDKLLVFKGLWNPTTSPARADTIRR